VICNLRGEYYAREHDGAFDREVRLRGNMASELILSVNGVKQTVNVDPDTPLLFVLRNELKLTGKKLLPTTVPQASRNVLFELSTKSELIQSSGHDSVIKNSEFVP
jgi:hypothetical protein